MTNLETWRFRSWEKDRLSIQQLSDKYLSAWFLNNLWDYINGQSSDVAKVWAQLIKDIYFGKYNILEVIKHLPAMNADKNGAITIPELDYMTIQKWSIEAKLIQITIACLWGNIAFQNIQNFPDMVDGKLRLGTLQGAKDIQLQLKNEITRKKVLEALEKAEWLEKLVTDLRNWLLKLSDQVNQTTQSLTDLKDDVMNESNSKIEWLRLNVKATRSKDKGNDSSYYNWSRIEVDSKWWFINIYSFNNKASYNMRTGDAAFYPKGDNGKYLNMWISLKLEAWSNGLPLLESDQIKDSFQRVLGLLDYVNQLINYGWDIQKAVDDSRIAPFSVDWTGLQFLEDKPYITSNLSAILKKNDKEQFCSNESFVKFLNDYFYEKYFH